MDKKAVLGRRMAEVEALLDGMELVEVTGIGWTPRHLVGGLYDYAIYGSCGGFLSAVLANDLKDALGRADKVSAHFLQEVVMVVINRLPAESQGSQGEVRGWEGWLRAYPGEPLPGYLHQLRADLGREDPVKR